LENEAKEEEAKDKEIQAEIVRKSSLKKRMGMTPSTSSAGGGAVPGGAGDGTSSAPAANPLSKGKQLSGVMEDNETEAEGEVLVDDNETETGGRSKGVDMDARGRASKSSLLSWFELVKW
jgi:hypothetical protein